MVVPCARQQDAFDSGYLIRWKILTRWKMSAMYVEFMERWNPDETPVL